jgi:hypothetical protein
MHFPEELSVPVSEITESVQTQVLDLLNKAQEATIDGVRTLAETVEGFVPELPALPFADRIPEASTIVDDAFDFAAKLLDSQRHFAQELFAAAAPVTSKSPATAPTTKPKPVVATKKSA